MNREGEECNTLPPNDAICTSIAKLYAIETGDISIQLPHIIKKSNLSLSVVLGALYLSLSSRGRAVEYIERLRREMELYVYRRNTLQKRIDDCLLLFSDSTMLFSISLIVSSKHLVDRAYVNRTWSQMLMINLEIVNAFERTLLEVLDHNVEINEVKLRRVLDRIREDKECRKGGCLKGGCLRRVIRGVTACFKK